VRVLAALLRTAAGKRLAIAMTDSWPSLSPCSPRMYAAPSFAVSAASSPNVASARAQRVTMKVAQQRLGARTVTAAES
jgi:hypothetical protein